MNILTQKQSAVERADNIKKLEEKYGNISVDEINALILKDALSTLQTEGSYIAEDCFKLYNDLKTEEVKQEHEINLHLKHLLAMQKAAELYDPKYVQAHMEMVAMKSKLKQIEEQDNIDVTIERNKLSDVKIDGRTSKFRKFSQTLVGMAKGFTDVHEYDIVYADNVVKLTQKKFAKFKIDSAEKVWKTATTSLIKNMKKQVYALEQKDKVTELIIQNFLHQSENAK